MPGVVPDHDAAAGVASVGEVPAEPRGCAGDDGGVHPGRPRAQRPAQTRRAERQRPGEPLLQLLDVLRLDQRLDLGSVAVVGVRVRPGAGGREQVGAHGAVGASKSGSVNSPPTRPCTGSAGSGSPYSAISAGAYTSASST